MLLPFRERRSCFVVPGFTLVEFLLYIAIVMILFIFFVDVLLSLMQGKTKLEAVNEVTTNTREAMERMELAIRNADSVTIPVAGTTSSRLVLLMSAVSLNPTIFSAPTSSLQIKEGASATTTLTGEGVEVQNLVFRNLGSVGTPGVIRIEMSVSSTNAGNDPYYASGQPVYGTATVRKRL